MTNDPWAGGRARPEARQRVGDPVFARAEEREEEEEGIEHRIR
jgi:hypothetical protein